MIKPKLNSKRKTRSDKFPLTLHPTGRYCKKIKSKLYCFGTDKAKALQQYLEQATYLHSGKMTKPASVNNMSLKTLCNLYLDHQELRSQIGEIKSRQVCDQTSRLRDFVKFIGTNQSISNIATIDLQNYRKKSIKAGKAPSTVNNHISAFKAMYHWAMDNEIIETIPNLKAIKKVSASKSEKAIFTAKEIRTLLNCADTQMKAMIWRGLCAALP